MVREKKDKSYVDNMDIENQIWAKGYNYIAGIDDVGRGCFAGPVVCASVIMPKGLRIDRLTDSKLIPKSEHQYFAEIVKESALAWGIGVVDEETIDKVNIKQATQLAMKKAVESMNIKPEYMLVDGLEHVDLLIPQGPIIKGDFVCHGISAASILAKIYRDDLMKELDAKFDYKYGWSSNAGYPTKAHIEATRLHGITPHHRKSWGTMDKL